MFGLFTHFQHRQDLMFIPFDNDPYPLGKQACLYLVFMCFLALSLSLCSKADSVLSFCYSGALSPISLSVSLCFSF